MKQIILSLMLCILFANSYAQTSEEVKEEASDSISQTEQYYIVYSWYGLSYGMAGYLSSDNQLSLPESEKLFDLEYSKSSSVSFNFYEYMLLNKSKHFRMSTGLGFEFNRYNFKRNITLNYDADSTWAVLDSTPNYTKNFLKGTYLNIPLLFGISSASRKRYYGFSAGIVGGIRIGSKTKQKYFEDGEKIKVKTRGDYNLNPFKASLVGVFYVAHLRVSASYDVTTLFLGNSGPEVTPFSIKFTYDPFTPIAEALAKQKKNK